MASPMSRWFTPVRSRKRDTGDMPLGSCYDIYEQKVIVWILSSHTKMHSKYSKTVRIHRWIQETHDIQVWSTTPGLGFLDSWVMRKLVQNIFLNFLKTINTCLCIFQATINSKKIYASLQSENINLGFSNKILYIFMRGNIQLFAFSFF